MTTPSDKSKEMTEFLEDTFGRTSAITTNHCVKPPFGCGDEAAEFRNEISRKEYTISGLCQKCQDKIFGKD